MRLRDSVLFLLLWGLALLGAGAGAVASLWFYLPAAVCLTGALMVLGSVGRRQTAARMKRADPCGPFVQGYWFDALPEGNPEWGTFRITVEYAGEGYWEVRRSGARVLRVQEPEQWDYFRPGMGERDLHGFRDLQEALRRAGELVWRIRVNRRTAAQVIGEFYPELTGRIPDEYRAEAGDPGQPAKDQLDRRRGPLRAVLPGEGGGGRDDRPDPG